MRNILTLSGIGESACLLIIQQALGMPDAKMQSDYMVDKVGLLMFARQSLPERICVTAAVRQMGGTTIYQGDQGGAWRSEMNDFQQQLLAIFGYYIDCLYTYGFPVSQADEKRLSMKFPIINAGSPDAHPAHAMADIACMLRSVKNLDGQKAAWVGCVNGTLHSLMEATVWFPFSLKISLPPQVDSLEIRQKAKDLKSDITFVDTPRQAVENARFIYAGWRGELSPDELNQWKITSDLLRYAHADAKLLLSASPIRAIYIEPDILASSASLLLRQSEYRLRVHKRILHWVFE